MEKMVHVHLEGPELGILLLATLRHSLEILISMIPVISLKISKCIFLAMILMKQVPVLITTLVLLLDTAKSRQAALILLLLLEVCIILRIIPHISHHHRLLLISQLLPRVTVMYPPRPRLEEVVINHLLPLVMQLILPELVTHP